MSTPNFDITVVVASLPVTVQVNSHQPVHELMTKALNEAGKHGEDLSAWFLRAGDHEFDPNKKISDEHIVAGMTLYLTKDAGGGG